MTAIHITMVLMLMMVTFRLIAVKLGHGSANAAVFPAAWGRCATLQNQ